MPPIADILLASEPKSGLNRRFLRGYSEGKLALLCSNFHALARHESPLLLYITYSNLSTIKVTLSKVATTL